MKILKQKKHLCLLFIIAIISSCTTVTNDPLPSWNSTSEKDKIIDFVENIVPQIPVDDRLAVFDMDGTVACEAPLWMEMYCAVQGLCMQVGKDSSLLQYPMYQYAIKLRENPKDTSVTNHWGSSIDEMVHSAFKKWDNEEYIRFCSAYLDTAMNRDYNITLAKTFYPPMLELLRYLQANDFEVYIVSGSLQGLLWSVCPDAIGFDRQHLIGTTQAMHPVYYPNDKTAFILEADIFPPSNNKDGKSLNIYSHIGKTPVFAFGNTTGDWGMFHLTSTNTLPNISFLLNHNDSLREYVYPPWHGTPCPAWKDTMAINGWNIVNMKENFNTVF
ncbi:MAG: haloacid dehalogenase-like hydrolase [Bacteroidales bacterium]|nr:haloacid dehalogenase-like hydrolase [Bacteroidales bacterium]